MLYAKETAENAAEDQRIREPLVQNENDGNVQGGEARELKEVSPLGTRKNQDAIGVQNLERPVAQVQIEEAHPYAHLFTLNSIMEDMGYILIAYIVLMAMILLRGGHGMRSVVGIDTCSATSWVILVVAQVICITCSYLGYKKHSTRLIGKENVEENTEKLHNLMLNSYLAGIIAGLLGVGGGMVMNPVMLNLGFPAEVSTAISAFVVFFTSSSTTAQFIIQGAVTVQDSIVFLVVSSIGSYIGGNMVSALVRKHRRPSYLIWLLLGFLVMALVIMPTLGVYRIFQTGILGFEKPC